MPERARERRAARELLGLALPRAWYRRRLDALLARVAEHDADDLHERVEYCHRVSDPFEVGPEARPFRLRPFARKHAYRIDFHLHARYFDPALRFRVRFGDNLAIPDEPCFVKARPIGAESDHSILFPLNRVRHFRFVDDPTPFRDKLDRAVWRGTAFQPQRRDFLAAYHDHPLCDVGEAGGRVTRTPHVRPVLTIEQQLTHRYVISIEGNDVATNLKWILSSSSLCVMPRPRNESWFMEGTLVAGRHYAAVRDDLADLEEVLRHYSTHPAEAEAIIRAANAHAARFRDPRREELVAVLVLRRYLELSGQLHGAP